MIARRDILLGSAFGAAAVAAFALKPRRRVSLLGRDKLAQIIPMGFGDWTSRDVGDLVAPKEEGSLASTLYNETVGRIYTHATTRDEVMMLLAHGDTQTDRLQLHRPEKCYPAVGYEVSLNQPYKVALTSQDAIPSRMLCAKAPNREEYIVYWTRIGEFLPVSGGQQRYDQMSAALNGYIADGLLARFSLVGQEAGSAIPIIAGFIVGMVRAVHSEKRPALIGTGLSRALAAAGV